MTIVLGIDSATPQVSVALEGPDGPLASLVVAGGRRHGELLAPAVAEVCRLAETPLAAVDRVAVDVGPGLFTGLRVGVATAGALAAALGIEAVALGSLELLAAAHPHHRGQILAVVDARRSEVFWARYGPGGVELDPPAVGPPEAVAEVAAGVGDTDLLVVGDGARRYADRFDVPVAGPGDAHPSAVIAARLGRDRPAVTGPLEPRYLRAPDVRIGWVSRD